MSEWAWACEGRTGGPRRRAAAFPDALAVGAGPRSEFTPSGQRYRSVQWCKNPNPLAGFPVVAGDCSVVALADRSAFTIGVHIDGQDRTPGCWSRREPDALWDCERLPLHPWADLALPSRTAVRTTWDASLDVLAVGCLEPSWAPRLFTDRVRSAAPAGVLVRRLLDPAELVGCDLAIVAAGWATVFEATCARVPFWAVDIGMRDHPARANCSYDQMCAAVSRLRWKPDLPDDLTPVVPDHREQFRDLVFAHA